MNFYDQSWHSCRHRKFQWLAQRLTSSCRSNLSACVSSLPTFYYITRLLLRQGTRHGKTSMATLHFVPCPASEFLFNLPSWKEYSIEHVRCAKGTKFLSFQLVHLRLLTIGEFNASQNQGLWCARRLFISCEALLRDGILMTHFWDLTK